MSGHLWLSSLRRWEPAHHSFLLSVALAGESLWSRRSFVRPAPLFVGFGCILVVVYAASVFARPTWYEWIRPVLFCYMSVSVIQRSRATGLEGQPRERSRTSPSISAAPVGHSLELAAVRHFHPHPGGAGTAFGPPGPHQHPGPGAHACLLCLRHPAASTAWEYAGWYTRE